MEDTKYVYSEVLGVLMTLGYKYIKRLPPNMIDYLKENCDRENIPQFDKNQRIENQNISEDARMVLTMIKLKYWCETEEEKQEIMRLLDQNEKEYQEEMNKKFSSENLFKNSKSEVIEENQEVSNTEIAEIPKKGFFARIVDKIKNFFKKRNG